MPGSAKAFTANFPVCVFVPRASFSGILKIGILLLSA
tara:strand:- start:452 stop:562 length:111 start_codon:yes stop_codon:yes gene_type:complete